MQTQLTTVNKNSVDIIDIILNARSLESTEAIEQQTDQPLITDSEFFAEGYATKEEFLKHIDSLSRNELMSLATIIDCMSNNEKLDVPPFESVDKQGRNYVWCVKRGKLGNSGFKLLTFGRLNDFIGLYLMGVIKSSFSLGGLREEALKK